MKPQKKDDRLLLDLYERGIKALYNKDYQQALELFEKLVEDFREEIELTDRARNFIKICQAQGAVKRVQAPKTVEEMFDLGVMEHNSGNYQKAIEHFKAAIEQNPKADYIHYALGASFAQSGDVDRAIHSLQKSIQLNSDNKFLARNDPDFESIRSTKEFGAIVEIPRSE
ncbi:MAG TPA: tetratricopeptide repeat protein [Acidobacteriota bacterium]